MSPRREDREIRWRLWCWPVGVMLVLTSGVLLSIWLAGFSQRQEQVVYTLLTGMLVATLLLLWSLIWLFTLSGARWGVRLSVLALLAGLLVAARFAVEVRGFSGDVVPLLSWRWSPRAGAADPGEEPTATIGGETLSSAFDWPQFQGPERDGSAPGVRLAREWTAAPRLLWRRQVGAGWSGFVVAGDFAVTHEQYGGEERVQGYELKDGRRIWSHVDPVRFEEMVGGPGPRATPAIDGGRVFALGATGILNALDLATGEKIWSVNIVEDNGATIPTYGVAASPLVEDGQVWVLAGGANGRSLVAYDAASGERRWSGGDGASAYGSPIAIELAGRRQIVLLNTAGVVGHDAADGRVLWQHVWPDGTERTFQPVAVPGDRVFVSTGYGIGGKLFQVRRDGDRFSVETVWESLGLKAKFSNVVQHNGHLYGLDDGILVCLDPATGERRWKQGRYGHGQIILTGDQLLIGAENGDVALVQATPLGHRETARFSALEGKTWNHPALAGRYLVVRNDRHAACYELPLEG